MLNNFGSAEKHIKLLVSVFQGLFPPIQVQTMHLSQARRIVLLHYNESTQTIEWRHYLISVRPIGVSRRVRRVIEGSSGSKANIAKPSQTKKIPNLSSSRDISEYLLGRLSGSTPDGGFETDASSASEADSDVEEGDKPSNHVQLPDAYVGRGNTRDSQRAVRLVELGPRMELRCVKIEEGIPGAGKDGKGSSQTGNDVLWHDYVNKTSAESTKQRRALAEKEALRKKRREEQEENVRRKNEEKGQKTSKRGKQLGGEDAAAGATEAQGKSVADSGEESEADDDEFAYEDAHGAQMNGDLFEEDDVLIDDEESIGDDDEEEEDESDLSPVEVNFNALDSSDEEEGSGSKKLTNHKRHKTNGK